MAVLADSLYAFDDAVRSRGFAAVCGVDEAGRGPLAGPVCAAAVILPEEPIAGLNDSKKLTARRREQLYDEITARAMAWSAAFATREEIDSINIRNAALLAMRRAVEGLTLAPEIALVDGDADPGLDLYTETVVKGDACSASIAAASIIAKVTRDRYVLELDKKYPEYKFAAHKGYGTKLHYEMLDAHGPCPEHRETFLRKWRASRGEAPVKNIRGMDGESYAAKRLEANGYRILERNWHSRYGEIDIIAEKDGIICFVEVKTRRPGAIVGGAEAVGSTKRRKIISTALMYLQERPERFLQPRFDLICVTANGGIIDCEHIEGAFDGEEYFRQTGF